MKRLTFSQVKEVPYEITFLLRDAQRDPKIPNRYWFDLPESWVDTVSKDPIIGIRSIYATKTNRFIWYEYTIELINRDGYDDPETEVIADVWKGEITHWLDGSDTLRVITDYFNNHWRDTGHRPDGYYPSGYEPDDPDVPNASNHRWEPGEIHCHYEYKQGFHRSTIATSDNGLHLVFGRGFLPDVVWIEDDEGWSRPYVYRITIMPCNWDTAIVFGLDRMDEVTAWTNVQFQAWSRYKCLVKSSLADMDKNNILGHTRNDPYNPIKYFRYKNYGLRRFWIELYETRYPDCPVIIPAPVDRENHEDDDVIIEALFCFSTDAMI